MMIMLTTANIFNHSVREHVMRRCNTVFFQTADSITVFWKHVSVGAQLRVR
jgi:hypothetical protein